MQRASRRCRARLAGGCILKKFMTKKAPPENAANFLLDSQVSRFIHKDYRMRRGRVSSAAFERKVDRSGTREPYLSVNSLEIDSVPTVVTYYRKTFENDRGQVALVIHKIRECNLASQVAGVSVKFDKPQRCWVYEKSSIRHPAYLLRKVPNSTSHSGIEFVKAFGNDTLAEKKFTRKMVNKKKADIY